LENKVVRATDEPSSYGKRAYAALIVAIVLWLIRYLPFLLPRARLWGINHLLFLPSGWTYGYFLGGCLILLTIFIPAARNIVSRLYESLAESLFDGRSRLKLILFAVAAAAVFWIFRLPIKLLGDSQTLIANIGNEIPVILKWSERASVYIVYTVAKILPVSGIERGRYAYEVVSVMSGAFTILFVGMIAYELAETAGRRLFLFMLMLFSGWIILFFGYTENYPILWIFMTGYIYYGIKYTWGRCNLLWPTVFLLAAIVIHLQALFFALSYPVLFFSRGRARRFYARRKKTVWAAAVILAVLGVAAFFNRYRNSLEFSLMIIPFFTGRPMTPNYWLFSPSHLLDIVNEYVLVTPLLPALGILGWKSPRAILTDKTGLFLGVLGLGGLAFIFIIDPKLGMARDWDLFALVGLPWLLLFARNVVERQRIHSGLYPAVILASGLIVLPWIATNLNYQPAVDYYKFALNLDLPRSRSGLMVLRQMYLAVGDSATADSLQLVVNQEFPATHLYPDAEKLIRQGRFKEAKILIDSLEMSDPTMISFMTLRGYWNLQRGDYQAALDDLEQAATLGKYNAKALVNLAGAYYALHRYKEMMQALRRGQRLDPNEKDILVALAAGFNTLGNYDSAAVYAKKLIDLYPDDPETYYILGLTAFKTGRTEAARSQLERYLDMAPRGSYAKSAEILLRNLK
jgi:tetratricopeptide (TPR) repeat protein